MYSSYFSLTFHKCRGENGFTESGSITVQALFGMPREVALLKSRDSEYSSSDSPVLLYLPQPNNSALAFCHCDSYGNAMKWKCCGLNNNLTHAGDAEKNHDHKGTVIVSIQGYVKNAT